MEPRSGQGRAGAMAFALFAGAFRLLAWINGGAALVLVFFMLGVIGSDVAAPDLQRRWRCTWRVSWAPAAVCSAGWRRPACCDRATPCGPAGGTGRPRRWPCFSMS